jgi:hypothetical protein
MTTTPAERGLFRKRPVVVDASQWHKNGDHPADYAETTEGYENGVLRQFTGEDCKARGWEGGVVRYFRHPDVGGETACKHCGVRMHEHGWIDTLEGGHIVCPGDWIITGVKGERYPCKDEIFRMTYEPASAALASSPASLEPAAATRLLVEVCHNASAAAGWWNDTRPGGVNYLAEVRAGTRFGKALVAEKLCLAHSEISEAMEGHRKSLMDDKLPNRLMVEVEIADAVIRLFDLAGALQLDLGGAIADKMAFNAVRPDHKLEARGAAGGKAY